MLFVRSMLPVERMEPYLELAQEKGTYHLYYSFVRFTISTTLDIIKKWDLPCWCRYVDVSTVDAASSILISKQIKDTGALFLEVKTLFKNLCLESFKKNI